MAAKTYLKTVLTIFAVLFLLAHLTFAALPRYEVIDLGTLGGRYSTARAINDAGQVVGWSYTAEGFTLAFLWDPVNGMIDLGTLDGQWSHAYSINRAGQIVGQASTASGYTRAILFHPSGEGNNIDLGTLGGDRSYASSINDNGQIVGGAQIASGELHATLFDPTGGSDNIDLGTLGGDESWASSINNSGQIVGTAYRLFTSPGGRLPPVTISIPRATLFDTTGQGNNIDLGALLYIYGGRYCSGAESINDSGQIVGAAWNEDPNPFVQENSHLAVLFDPTGGENNIFLGTLGWNCSSAYSINNRDQIIGWGGLCSNNLCGKRPALFDPTGQGNNVNIYDLIEPSCGWILKEVCSINNSGWIVGQGINPDGETHAFLMTPVPPKIIYVDDDAPEDPGPGDPTISDPLEDGTQIHPFDVIQEAIDVALHGDTILVARGIYFENINFMGKNITLRSTEPTNLDIVQNTTIEGKVCFRGTEDQTCTLSGFNIDGYIVGFDYNYGLEHTHATISHCLLGAIFTPCAPAIFACDGNINNCVIEYVYYMCTALIPDIMACHGLIENCTILAWMDIQGGGTCTLENCIIYESSIKVAGGATLNVSYCDLEGGLARISGSGNVNWGPGNIDADPLFVDADSSNYHLLTGSPCIDAGDPEYIVGPNETDLDGNPRVINDRIDMGAYEFNRKPIADAGEDQTAYAWIDGIAEVTLDGVASFDDESQPLSYKWSWTIDGNNFTATEPNITIELPVGEYVIELIVNDGIDDSEPDQVIVTVVEAAESKLWILPRTINRHSRQKYILASVRLPEGITKGQIDTGEPLLLYPGGVEELHQYIFQSRRHGTRQTSILAFFDKAELMEAVSDNGQVELQVVGRLKTGQYFYGTDTVRIVGWHRFPLRSFRGPY